MAEFDGDRAGGVDVLDRELEKLLNDEQLDEGDHERFSHYVKKEQILESAVTGKPVKALCGKCGLLVATRKSSRCAQPAKKSTKR